MERVCVYCGSSPGRDPAYVEAAADVGRLLAERDVGLVYGGGSVGMMGAVADAALEAGGEVVGVIPRGLVEKESAREDLTELRVVDSMHERKEAMADLSDGFVALPGGLGTLEEIFEVLTWAQLGIHDDPCGFLNAEGYFDDLVAFLDHASDQGFVSDRHRGLALVDDDPASLLDRFADYESPQDVRWMDEAET